MTRPTSTVVIATRGNPALVVDAVRSILEGAATPDQLIVVDQTQPYDPRVAALAEHAVVEVIHSDTVGLALAQNVAVRTAAGEAILFTDDDVLVDPHWLTEMVGALALGGPRTAVTGRVLATAEEVTGGRAIALATGTEPTVHRGRLRRDVLSGNSMGFFRSAFAECGLFDERLGTGSRFGSASDNDFGYRLLRAGYEIRYVPQAILYHRARRTSRELAKANRDYGRGQGAFLAKHALAGDRFMASRLLSTVGWWLRRVATRPLRDRKLRGHGDFRYLAAFLGGVAGWWLDSYPWGRDASRRTVRS